MHLHKLLRCATAVSLACVITCSQAGALQNASSWAQSDLDRAETIGLMPSSLTNLSATSPITRAEFCAVVLNTYRRLTGQTVKVPESSPFTDCSDPAVSAAYALGLVNGRGNGIFAPDDTISRQDLCVMLQNVLTAANVTVSSNSAALAAYPDKSQVSSYAHNAVSIMVENHIVNGVSSANQPTLLLPLGTATREQAIIMALRFCGNFSALAGDQYDPEGYPIDDPDLDVTPEVPEPDPDVTEEPDDNTPDLYAPQTEAEKMELVYGVGGEKYQTAEEAEANMVEISVPVWRLQEDGTKTTGTAYLTVQKNLAPIYQAIFEEIYNGDEKFPIKNVGCYSWRTGEHSQGTAVDINWEENMEATINEDGSLTPTTGTHWTPGEDPYSIPEYGDVYNAFTKYGFAWGGNAWSSKRDYMHFSYFGR